MEYITRDQAAWAPSHRVLRRLAGTPACHHRTMNYYHKHQGVLIARIVTFLLYVIVGEELAV